MPIIESQKSVVKIKGNSHRVPNGTQIFLYCFSTDIASLWDAFIPVFLKMKGRDSPSVCPWSLRLRSGTRKDASPLVVSLLKSRTDRVKALHVILQGIPDQVRNDGCFLVVCVFVETQCNASLVGRVVGEMRSSVSALAPL